MTCLLFDIPTSSPANKTADITPSPQRGGVIDRAIVLFGEGSSKSSMSSVTSSSPRYFQLPTVAGVYVLRLINGDDVKTRKIVVR